MSLRRAVGVASLAVLGGAVVVLPAAAGSETAPAPPQIVAENVPPYTHRWAPPELSLAPGGAVEFSNPTEVPHGIRWVSTPGGDPECSSGVPVGTSETASGRKWSGSCTFTAAGTYTFYCTVHGAAMSGTITVVAPTAGGPPSTSAAPSTPATGPGGAPVSTITPPPAVATLTALRLLAQRHGSSVRGSLLIAPAGAGGTLVVVLQARLAAKRVQVGRFMRGYLSAGAQSWSIELSARARRALRAKHRLLVSATVTLTAPGGTPVSLHRFLEVRR